MATVKDPVVLCILDGIGEREQTEFNAFKLAHKPTLERLIKNNLSTLIRTDGEYVGLPKGQMGNSEVGHTNIGAGRIVFQTLPRINVAIENKEFENNQVLQNTITKAKQHNATVHIMGLLSDGGIHSHILHFLTACEIFAKNHLNVRLHLFTDGRDTPPTSAKGFVNQVNQLIQQYPNIKIATVCGRYYAMDRDKRWERVELAYNAIVNGKGLNFNVAEEAIDNGYEELKHNKIIPSDEFIKPSVIADYDGIKDNDVIFSINFRADRVREILTAILDPNFTAFTRKNLTLTAALGMVNYSVELDKLLTTVFPKENLTHTLGEVIANAGLKQLRAAETEKYPHVTFFFNGGIEAQFNNEDRILIPSPKVATYDLQPEMSANPLKEKIVEAINSKAYDLIVVNFANGDMVGHTGVLEAAIKAVETVDSCVEVIEKAIISNAYTLIITADHGNCETMWDDKNNAPHTQHTTNPVRITMVNVPDSFGAKSLNTGGKLADIAPTILQIMGVKKPKSMTGENLLSTLNSTK